ncbi:MAG: AAA family ATPase [Candidatus Magasanikbacteria bacterium RIFCSPHIGHO2_02_FULL_50_9b]|uniref:AAA family ATPase n=1 Tax=Candidatus Magasanikbacteria bacterium RIFCSPHIGHO2_02_FULL_50_9b TaxID=1798682 RepID=A0A1F6M936_9BACT|nr:MAG: AAA family ATPase [Candidatus Magasanikbacteria bacterium RIFCSPHIGHO2_02_FULL_50_9b]
MIVYQSTKLGFLEDASNGIEDVIRDQVKEKLNINVQVGSSEYNSWKNSLGDAMYKVMQTSTIPDDSGVAIEYSIPRTKNRIDFLITGQDDHGHEKVVVIELKQWTNTRLTDKDAMVEATFRYGHISEELHPSYQAWSYTTLLNGFNATVYNEGIQLESCSYLHNEIDDSVINHDFYKSYTDQSPAFCKGDKEKLQKFIAQYIKYGDNKKTLFRIDNSAIRPSKALADSIASMLKGNDEFIMIDDQKIVYETALSLARSSSHENKNVLIVNGGPGTGKSVVAINLLSATKKGLNARYVTRNSAPRLVFESMLTKTFRRTEFSNLFSGTGSFVDADANDFDILIVDEAHRLTEKSNFFGKGDNQIKEIINASKFSIFFIDEDQKVTLNDIGEKGEIRKFAEQQGAKVTEMSLESQFRCNGSDGYLSWLDNTLQIRETANIILDDSDYEFCIFDDPQKLHDFIIEKNKEKNKARMVAGYCWKWISKKQPSLKDIVIGDYAATWNLNSHGQTWIAQPDSVTEVGCIHTAQGLEVDYVGVIVGHDLTVRNGKVITDVSKRSGGDKSVHGWKGLMKEDPIGTKARLDAIIKNTYRTLMTRGMKGCYVYFTDKETEEFFRKNLGLNKI